MKTQTFNPAVSVKSKGSVIGLASMREYASVFFRTTPDPAGLVLRLGLAAVMFPHGAQKALGWFGGPGLQGTLNGLTQYLHIPWLLALAVIAGEFLGAIALAAGFFTRLSAFAIGTTMAVAALQVHLANGFFMNWAGNQKGEGIEFFVLAVALSIALVLKGGGRLSLDRLVARKLEEVK